MRVIFAPRALFSRSSPAARFESLDWIQETRGLLFQLGVPILPILGNAEVAVLAHIRGLDPGPMPAAALEAVAWTAHELGREHEALFSNWPKTLRLQIAGLGEVLFCHGTPRHENEVFTRLTPEHRLLHIFGGVGADLVVCGHTHMQFDRLIGGLRVLNAGSVGMTW